MDRAEPRLTEEQPRGPESTADGRGFDDYLAALIGTASIIPVVAAMVTVLGYSLARSNLTADWLALANHPLISGTANLVLAWLSVATLYYLLGFTSPDRANAGSYSALRDRLRELRARCSGCQGEPSTHPENQCSSCLLKRIAWEEACAHRDAIATELRSKGPRWVLGTGYVNLWKRVQSAEEALIMVEPREAVIAGARYDELRCRGSDIDSREKLQDRVTAAVHLLRVLPAGYSHEHAHVDGPATNGGPGRASAMPAPAAETAVHAASSEGSHAARSDPGWTGDAPHVGSREALHIRQFGARATADNPQSEPEARADLRRVRRSIDEFRSDRWAGLVRARNLLTLGAGLTGLVLYSLLWLAIIQGAGTATIGAATSYFLVGAMVGLFNQLYSDSKATTVVDDYGLSLARLMVTPLISGVAAVSGVVVISMLSVSQLATDASRAAFSLAEFFDLGKLPFNVVVAATFGLTPGLLLDRLKQQTEQYKADLQTSKAADSTKRG
jgi:riboflavin transporter FmnP